MFQTNKEFLMKLHTYFHKIIIDSSYLTYNNRLSATLCCLFVLPHSKYLP